MQIHKSNIYFKGDTLEVGAVRGIMYEKLDTGTDFDKFRDKLKAYVEINLDNTKDVLCVITDMEYPMIFFEEDNMSENLDKEEAKSTPKKKRLELALTRYMDREEKLEKS